MSSPGLFSRLVHLGVAADTHPRDVRYAVIANAATCACVMSSLIGTIVYAILDRWGDTVNTAARMESHGEPGRIQVTDECRQAIGERFMLEDRGTVPIKGKGPMHTGWLNA